MLNDIMKDIMVIGDLHGIWRHLNELINKKKPKIILQCGDFGWWPKFHNITQINSGEYEELDGEIIGDPWDRVIPIRKYKKWDQYGIKSKETKIYWCDGNHEDHWDLINKNKEKAPLEIMPNVFYMKRGSVLELPDKRKVLFMGGADSVDKHFRTTGIDWFPEEVISQKDMYILPDIEIDIVISHTCPLEFHEYILARQRERWGWQERIKDPSAHALSYVLNKYKPKLWYFGHFHSYIKGFFEETEWYALNMVPENKWWVYLRR